MSCREYEADIVDLARGAGVSVGLRGHLDACAGCAARFAREQQLTAGLGEVADAAPQPSRSNAIEAQLLRAFAAQHAAGSREAASRRPPFAARTAWGWLAAAAVLVLAVVVWRGTTSRQAPDAAGPAPAAVATKAAEVLAAAPAAPAAAAPAPRRDEAAIATLSRNVSPQAAPGRPAAAGSAPSRRRRRKMTASCASCRCLRRSACPSSKAAASSGWSLPRPCCRLSASTWCRSRSRVWSKPTCWSARTTSPGPSDS